MNDKMNITSAQYVAWDGVNDSITATIEDVEYSVPLAPGNSHYDEIMRQVDAGELTIEEAD
jgi:hypothetical protein